MLRFATTLLSTLLFTLFASFPARSQINFLKLPGLSELGTGGFTLSWETDIDGTTELFYGNTANLELGKLAVPGTGTIHEITLYGASPSELFYVQPFSVHGKDTAKAGILIYITQSNSSGKIKAFFNRPVGHSVSSGTDAIYLHEAMDDTLISYIKGARQSIDMAVYNLNNKGISNISNALNDAHKRGVIVRVVYDVNQSNTGISELNASIGRMASPRSQYPLYGIMHNKFVVFDALSDNPGHPLVWTGSTNFTEGQIKEDPNNVLVIQDKSLAIAYRMEFNEMFGSEGAQPDAEASRFGPDKSDNTPHEFVIGGIDVESYFSPSDSTHSQILSVLQSAKKDLSVATMLITKNDLAFALRDRKEAGVDTRVLVKDEVSCSETVVSILKNSLQHEFRVSGEANIMHHKYAIVDQSDSFYDSRVLTGSHNWSNAAQLRNDENTLVIHDRDLANQYYQDFANRYKTGNAPVNTDKVFSKKGALLYPNPTPGELTIKLKPGYGPFILSLYDLTGKKILEDSSLSASDGRIMLSLNAYPNGYYYIVVENAFGTQTVLPLIIQR